MSPLLILVASLFGSPHCAGMCGGFVSVAAQGDRPIMSQGLYHFGRLVTYITLGAAAGALGGALNRSGELVGLAGIASLVSGTVLILCGINQLTGKKLLPRLKPFARFIAHTRSLLHRSSRSELVLPLALGISSTLLPCGWLYSYVTVAAGTASAGLGVLVMAVFWVGTLPLLMTVGGLAQFISSPLKRYLPTVTAILIIGAGFFSLFGHFGLGVAGASHDHCAMMGHAEPASSETSSETSPRLETAPSEPTNPNR
ncbi:MAG: sulfite exporter TauE/SafE family protein [Bdellovibrionota bacterium]